MLRTILKLLPVLVLTCVLVVGSWEPNNFGLSLGASAPTSLSNICWGFMGNCVDMLVVVNPPAWLQEAASPMVTVIVLFVTLSLLVSLNRYLAYGRNRSVITGFIGEQRIFYVRRGLAAHRARHKL
jgi:hypothetical protein